MTDWSALPQLTHRAYVVAMLSTCTVLGILVLILNLLVDPLWHWRGNVVTGRNLVFNEREAKMNLLLRKLDQFDCVVFGSSRATLLPSRELSPHRCFNMAFSAGVVEEFIAFAEYLRHVSFKPKLVIVAVDGFNFLSVPPYQANVPDYIRSGTRPPGMLQSYLTVAAAGISWRTLREESPLWRYYDSQFEGRIRPSAPPFRPWESLEAEGLRRGATHERAKLPFLPAKVNPYARFGEIFPEARVIAYVPPISAWHVAEMKRDGVLPGYVESLYAASRLFSRFLDYSVPSAVTGRVDNTYDGSHYALEANAQIARELVSTDPLHWGIDVRSLSPLQYVARYLGELEAFEMSAPATKPPQSDASK